MRFPGRTHFSIMEWGVRRYQNYDGSYTKKGLERYRRSESHYNNTKAKYKAGQVSKAKVSSAKKQLNKSYKELKKDYMADQGKQLHNKNVKIKNTHYYDSVAKTELGAGIVTMILAGTVGNYTLADAAFKIGLGSAVVAEIYKQKAKYENKRLRSFYNRVPRDN